MLLHRIRVFKSEGPVSSKTFIAFRRIVSDVTEICE